MPHKLKEGPCLVLGREHPLDIMRLFSHHKVRQSKIVHHHRLLAHEPLKLIELHFVFLKEGSFGVVTVIMKEKGFKLSSDLSKHRQKTLDLSGVLRVFSKEFLRTPFLDNVSMDSCRLSDIGVVVNQIG